MLIPLNDAFLFWNIENNTFWAPPPPPKGSGIRTVAIRLHAQVFVYTSSPLTWIFTRSRLSDSVQSYPFFRNYYLIIVAFSHPHFSIYDIFLYKRKLTSFNARATHFKLLVSLLCPIPLLYYETTISFWTDHCYMQPILVRYKWTWEDVLTTILFYLKCEPAHLANS